MEPMAPSMHRQHIPTAAAYAVLAALSYSLMSLFVKLVGERLSTDQVLFGRYVIGLALLSPWVLARRREALKTGHFFKFFIRSFWALLSVGSFFYALRYMPLGNALVLNNTFPLFIPIVTWMAHKIRTPRKLWIGIGLGFLGVAFVLHPQPQAFHLASLIALASGIFAAITLVYIRFMTKETSTFQILFYNFLICSGVTALFLPFDWVAPTGAVLLWLFGAAIFGLIYQYCSTAAIAKASVRLISPLLYLSILFGMVADALIWKLIPDALSIAGAVCIVVGGILTILLGKKEIQPQ